MQSIQVKRSWSVSEIVVCVFILYIGTYAVLLVKGWFDLARSPWNNREDSLLYKLFLPLEWLRHIFRR